MSNNCIKRVTPHSQKHRKPTKWRICFHWLLQAFYYLRLCEARHALKILHNKLNPIVICTISPCTDCLLMNILLLKITIQRPPGLRLIHNWMSRFRSGIAFSGNMQIKILLQLVSELIEYYSLSMQVRVTCQLKHQLHDI